MKPALFAIAVIGCTTVAFADSGSIASIKAGGLKRPDGITLTGADVEIGQVEVARTALPSFDSDDKSNDFVIPAESKNNAGQMPSRDDFLSAHAVEVAGIMIGKTGAPTSVSPNANLYSTGFGSGLGNLPEVIATQYIAKKFPFNNPNHIRVINHSWGDIFSDEPHDGNSQLTLGMDWIASRFDVLNVIAGAESGLGEDPTDNYNGITIASLAKEPDGTYVRVAADNDNEDEDDAFGERVSVDLLAPGEGLTLATAGVMNPTTTVPSGTSYAAPHVTGAVALLNEYSDWHVTNSIPRWDSDNTRKHEVMKAVLLNSADKIDNVHGSSRTILDENGSDWTTSLAFNDPYKPLDQQMGAGALNVASALKQFSNGEYNVGESIPKIGWDYGETGGFGTLLSYPFSSTVEGYVSITLAWDRKITKNGGPDDTFTGSDIFTGNPVDDLDLYLVPVGWTSLFNDAIAMSIAVDDSIEHIFKSVAAGDYEIVVHQVDGGDTDFGLAWWAGDDAVPGDFNGDGMVDAADLAEWKSNFGTGPGADADGDGDSDGADFLAWQQNFGATSVAAVPEPSALLLLVTGLPLLARRRAA